RVRILAPVSAHDSVAKTLTMLGITIYKTALTQGDVGVFDSGSSNQVRIDGFMDGGQVYATDVQTTSNSTIDPVQLQGPVTSVDPSSLTFHLLGVRVDLSDSMDLRGPDESPLTAQQFHDLLAPDVLLDLEDGTWDGSKITNDAGGPTTISFED
ncbi:MAG TPA: DUF5666 domain-containing protein, partial [bacterium]|nr:DUF5666 domain-containing protein [bacterium]